MFKPTHDKKFFCKYVTAEVAKIILSTLKVRCSLPVLFNDPFDTQQDFNPEDNDVLEILVETIKKALFKEEEPNYDKMDYLSTTQLKLLRSNRKKIKPEEWLPEMQRHKDEIIPMFRKWLKELNDVWQVCCADDRIFCVVEDYDNLLMWAHYADCHRGAVIKLRCIPELDTALCAATPIKYSNKMPLWTLIENWYTAPSITPLELVQKLFYTKSNEWSYEKEWRIVLKKRGDGSQNYEDIGIHKDEIEAVYLGCKICHNDKNKILNLVNTKMQRVRVFQACKNQKYFKLDFIQIR